jgi:tetratricopeptide (TPR) repeat protein
LAALLLPQSTSAQPAPPAAPLEPPADPSLAALSVGAVSPPPATGASVTTQQEAKMAQAQAAELFHQGRFAEAAELLRYAYAGDPHPILLFNAGQAYRKAERALEAKYMYERFVQTAPDHPLAPEARGYMKDIRPLRPTQRRCSTDLAGR